MSDKKDKEEEEEVRTFHCPQDEQHPCCAHETPRHTDVSTEMAQTVPISSEYSQVSWQESIVPKDNSSLFAAQKA